MAFPFSGGGDYPALGLPAGGGDELPRFGLGAGNYLRRFPGAIPFRLASAFDLAPTQQDEDVVYVGEEGGYFLELSTPLENYFTIQPIESGGGAGIPVPHAIQLIDATGQTWPLLRDACYGGVPVLGAILVPRAGGRVLRFASPHAPEGLYTLRVTRADFVLDVPNIVVRVIPAPFSREVNTVRAAFPIEVYNPYPD